MYQNTRGSKFNAVICRAIQDGFILKPEVNVVIEGVAISTNQENPGGLICQYAGRATMLRYSGEERPQDEKIISTE